MKEAEEKPKKVIVRFPPSPTGNFHIGSARTALFNYLFAKHAALAGVEAKIILRFEDTDRERSKKEYEQNIFGGLKWLGLELDMGPDGKPYRQSERGEMYKKYLHQLVDSGKAFISKEAPKEVGQRAEVIRFKNPNIKITFHDLIRGDIQFDTAELGDFVIAKDFDQPLYHLAVVVDDHEMGVTHVIRGEDHISNTPRQILIQRAIGANQPLYAHIPLILAPDRSKMSKRHGATALSEYRDRGYLPQAMVNFLALLGWNPGTAQEILSMDELIAQFDLAKVQKSGAIFNEEKLRWLNAEYMRNLHEVQKFDIVNKIFSEVYPAMNVSELIPKITPLIFERAKILNDVKNAVTEFSYLVKNPTYEAGSLIWQKEGSYKGSDELKKTRERLKYTFGLIDKIPQKDFSADKIKSAVWDYATQEGRGQVLWPMRMSLSGRDKSPDPFQLAEILGKEETLARLKEAIGKLSA